ncbi:MAG: AMP-binding protein, partial [Gammaproteobacteria bacterium]|nr:AMP-binding protein [Gammaproteobacteria bacterium]
MRKLEKFDNLVSMFFTRARELGDAPFLWAKSGGKWHSTSWAESARKVASLAAALRKLGLKPGDRVMLVSENRPEWCLSDLAIMAAGGVTVPTYTTNTERDHQHIIDNSGATMTIVSDGKLAKTLLPAILHTAGSAGHVVIGMEEMKLSQPGAIDFHDWNALIAANPADVGEAEQAAARMKRADLACIIYTSGTGGSPRGVMQHHGAILTNVEGC